MRDARLAPIGRDRLRKDVRLRVSKPLKFFPSASSSPIQACETRRRFTCTPSGRLECGTTARARTATRSVLRVPTVTIPARIEPEAASSMIVRSGRVASPSHATSSSIGVESMGTRSPGRSPGLALYTWSGWFAVERRVRALPKVCHPASIPSSNRYIVARLGIGTAPLPNCSSSSRRAGRGGGGC